MTTYSSFSSSCTTRYISCTQADNWESIFCEVKERRSFEDFKSWGRGCCTPYGSNYLRSQRKNTVQGSQVEESRLSSPSLREHAPVDERSCDFSIETKFQICFHFIQGSKTNKSHMLQWKKLSFPCVLCLLPIRVRRLLSQTEILPTCVFFFVVLNWVNAVRHWANLKLNL